jgi:hypothetical protein
MLNESPRPTQVNGKAAAARMFVDHPHLRIPEASIEVMEIPERTGM